MLIDIKQYLKRAKIVTLFELVQTFQSEPAVIRDMLEWWIAKRKITRTTQQPGCGSKCFQCDPAMTEVYQWVE